MLEWLTYAVLGKLIVYLWQLFPIPEPKKTYISQFIYKLHQCDLCSGVYLLTALAFFMKIDLLTEFGFSYVPFVSEFVSGYASSFVIHVFSVGWNAKFKVLVI
jgi:hypothetical protein